MNNQNAFSLIECARGMGPAPFRVLVPGASQRSVHTHDAFHEQCALARFIAQRAINASLRADSTTPPMDEPPFLDTDIGRASLLLTLEDFAFFVSEFELGGAVDVHAL